MFIEKYYKRKGGRLYYAVRHRTTSGALIEVSDITAKSDKDALVKAIDLLTLARDEARKGI